MTSPADWLRQLKQEWTIPDIYPERCVHSHCEISGCDLCVDSCPQDAWQLDDERLAIDTGRCDGCGLCVAACPESALGIPLSAALTEHQGRKTLLFACEAADTGADTGVAPCLHAITADTLLDYYQAGYRQIISARGDCASCPRHALIHNDDPFRRHLAELNRLLASRLAPTIRHAQVPGEKWRQYQQHKPPPQTTRRRHFLRYAAIQAVEYVEHNAGEKHQREYGSWAKKLPPPDTEENQQAALQPLYPFVPEFDLDSCTGCDACIRLCPHQAITLIHSPPEQQGAGSAYQITPENCTGCKLCEEVCAPQTNAIRIKHMHPLNTDRVPLNNAACQRCGNPFHYPVNHNKPAHQQCPVCTATSGQRQRLFRVD